jgi:hypothetical protein
MASQASPGLFRRLLTALGGVLARGILGQSAHDHMKQFTGSDEYWDRAIAARMAWPQERPPVPDPDRPRRSRAGELGAGPAARDTTLLPPGPAQEPIPECTERPLAEALALLARNKGTHYLQLVKEPMPGPGPGAAPSVE